jgi:hypothetical protein
VNRGSHMSQNAESSRESRSPSVRSLFLKGLYIFHPFFFYHFNRGPDTFCDIF